MRLRFIHCARPACRFGAGLLAGALLACDAGGESGTGLDAEAFVEVMVELRRAQDEATSQAEFDAARATILRERGLQPEDLYEFVDRTAPDVTRMTELWDSIEARLAAAPDSGNA